jgi:hypothetical protein
MRLPSGTASKPQSKLEAARQLGRQPGLTPRDMGQKRLGLLMALAKYDRGRCGILQATVVAQFAKLHQVWDSVPDMERVLRECEPEGMRGRVHLGRLRDALAAA